MKPNWVKDVKIGDTLSIKDHPTFTRACEVGRVVSEPNDKGVNLEFFGDPDWDEDEQPSIEFYEWFFIEPVGSH